MDHEKNLNDDQLNSIAGGTDQEDRELKAFIRKHDPEYRIYNRTDIFRWLYMESGISFRSVGDGLVSNKYVLSDGTSISHEQLMQMLNSRFPDEAES